MPLNKGAQLVLFSYRSDFELDDVVEFFRSRGFEFKAINKNHLGNVFDASIGRR